MTAAARSVCASLFVLVLLDGGSVAVIVCDRVLHAGALALSVGLNAARRLRCLIFFVA